MGLISRRVEDVYNGLMHSRHDPDGTVFYFSHSDFDGLFKKDYSFTSKRGHILDGGFYFYDNPRKDRLIVFDHGLGIGHRAYFREIEMLCRHGYAVYSYDHTGCGNSGGEKIMGFGGSLSDLDDCLNALKNIDALSGVEISVIGHSWGGYSTLNILGFHPEIHSVVGMSAFLSAKIMLKQAVPPILFPYRVKFYNKELELNPDYIKSSALDVLSSTDKPVLVIHSLDDSTVSAKRNILKLRKETCDKENIEFILQNGKRHSVSYTTEAADYKRAFFKELKKRKKQGTLSTDEEKREFISEYDWYAMTEQDEDLWEKIFTFLDK